ncbi:MAG: TonB-dependent receptor, partial [Gemmatimonadetes bacterium]|nr:TonB-dependent receptor [Gemmatimonadota bacterium]
MFAHVLDYLPSRDLVVRLLAILALGAARLSAQDPVDDLMSLSLEDLMSVEVSISSRSEQPLSAVAGAVHILTRDDIRRSGATSIAELLRLVPGMQVARIDANKWAISARGFNERFANKLLVQVDGRTVYTPAFSGVYWEELDIVLPDIERIKVIRGPGATLWGANAVNGIVNIVTQSAAQTQGGLVQAAVGDEDRAILSLRHGGRFGSQGHYRVFAKVRDHDAARDTSGVDARDAWSMARAGSRLDWSHAELGAFHVEAEALVGDLHNQVRLPQLQAPFYRRQDDAIEVVGGHVLGRWHRAAEDGTQWTAQMYYNVQDREEFVEQRIQTFDVDLQNRRQRGPHDVVWGSGFRVTRERFSQPLALSVHNVSPSEQTFSLFLQDDISLGSGAVHLILGSKLEHNDLTGLEIQPTARVRWSPSNRVTWWSSLSRAVRTPSPGEQAVLVILPDAS